jgi:hypothetical protein
MVANFNLRQHEHSRKPDMTEATAPSARPPHPRETAGDKFIKLVIICGYLWVVFALLSIHKSIALSEYHLDFPEQIFAIVNLLVFAKVLLIGENLHLETWVSRQAPPDKSHTLRPSSEEDILAVFTPGELKEHVTMTVYHEETDRVERRDECPKNSSRVKPWRHAA